MALEVARSLNLPNLQKILFEYKIRLSLHKEIQYEGLDVFDGLIKARMAVGEPGLVFLVTGCRKTGKTTNSIRISDYAESVLGRKPTNRRMIFQVDWAFHPRGSAQRSLEKPLEEYYRWDELQRMLGQLVSGMKNGQEKIILRPEDGIYLRTVGGTTHSKRDFPWGISRFIHQPHPVAVVEGMYAHAPLVKEQFIKEGMTPIEVLFKADEPDQVGRALDQKPSSRSLEDEMELNRHDVHAWGQIDEKYQLSRNADVLAWSFNGKVAFHLNPYKYTTDTVGLLV